MHFDGLTKNINPLTAIIKHRH